MKPLNHFRAEMDKFAKCILEGKDPKTDGTMGLTDVQLIRLIYQAAREKRPINDPKVAFSPKQKLAT